jgi:hypothetical protein
MSDCFPLDKGDECVPLTLDWVDRKKGSEFGGKFYVFSLPDTCLGKSNSNFGLNVTQVSRRG